MIKLRDGETILKAVRAYELNEKMKEISKELDLLKDWFKAKIGSDSLMEVGPVLISITESIRESLDKEELLIKLGPTEFQKFKKSQKIKSIHFKKVG